MAEEPEPSALIGRRTGRHFMLSLTHQAQCQWRAVPCDASLPAFPIQIAAEVNERTIPPILPANRERCALDWRSATPARGLSVVGSVVRTDLSAERSSATRKRKRLEPSANLPK